MTTTKRITVTLTDAEATALWLAALSHQQDLDDRLIGAEGEYRRSEQAERAALNRAMDKIRKGSA